MMERMHSHLRAIAACACLSIGVLTLGFNANSKPANIVIIYADDLGYGDVGTNDYLDHHFGNHNDDS